jgi:hypothetical protein
MGIIDVYCRIVSDAHVLMHRGAKSKCPNVKVPKTLVASLLKINKFCYSAFET